MVAGDSRRAELWTDGIVVHSRSCANMIPSAPVPSQRDLRDMIRVREVGGRLGVSDPAFPNESHMLCLHGIQ